MQALTASTAVLHQLCVCSALAAAARSGVRAAGRAAGVYQSHAVLETDVSNTAVHLNTLRTQPLQDFIFAYRSGIEAVRAPDVLAAAQRHLHADGQAAVVVGDAASVGPALREAGFEVLPLPLGED